MRELIEQLRPVVADGAAVAIATAVGASGSTPRPIGSSMAVTEAGDVIGSLSGGCVEAAVYDASIEVLAGAPPLRQRFGVGDGPVEIGLSCGGSLDVLVRRSGAAERAQLLDLIDAVEARRPVATCLVTGGPVRLGAAMTVWPDRVDGSLGAEGLDAAVTDDARGLLAVGLDDTRHYGASGQRRHDDVEVLISSFQPPARMLVFGAIDYAAALTRVGALLGFDVTVCDARPVFATRRRFPDAVEVVCQWPHDYLRSTSIDERAVICVLTHDPKFDDPLLDVALRSRAGYVGAMGSRRTHEERLGRLRQRGLPEGLLARLRSPIGLDLGARTPEETAVSIAAEVVQHRWGGTGRPLLSVPGAIHRDLSVR